MQAEYQAKEATLRAKRDKQKAELMQAREVELRHKAERAQAARDELERERCMAEELAEAEAAAQQRKLAAIKGRMMSTQDFLKTQIKVCSRTDIHTHTYRHIHTAIGTVIGTYGTGCGAI